MNTRSLLSAIVLLTLSVTAGAQSAATDSTSHTSLGKRLNQKITKGYYKEKYDTNYVVRPREKWLLRLLGNYAGNYIHAKGTVNNVFSKYDLHTRRNASLSLEVNYCDIAASLSLNPDKLRGIYDDYELNLEYHSNIISIDFNYQRSTSLAGDMKMDNSNVDHLDEDGLRMNVVNLAGYYTFNHRQFSFPAALFQNYRQLRSAGSWLAGVSFQGGSIKTTDELKARSPLAPEVHLTFANVAIGGGYGYNLVLGKHSQWLLHLSAMPTFVAYKHNRLTVNSQEKKDSRASFNMIFNERAAVVYHFTNRYFAGASLTMSNSVFDDTNVVVRQNKWLARAFLGLRL